MNNKNISFSKFWVIVLIIGTCLFLYDFYVLEIAFRQIYFLKISCTCALILTSICYLLESIAWNSEIK